MPNEILCEVPQDCVLEGNVATAATEQQMPGGFANVCGEVAAGGGDQCQTRCDPCQVPPEYPPCPPNETCDTRCDCGDYAGCCYQQPPRVQPIRPVACLMRSTAPLETNTIYKCSYIGNCGDVYRSKPVYPCHNLQSVKEPLEKCTVQKLSYMPHCNVVPRSPIRPMDNGLRFDGPLYGLTSQKHDYVPKGFCKREPFRPIQALWKPNAKQDICTINKLSYMPVDVCKNPPPKPIRHSTNYERPTGPTEQCTVQKLSYLPVCLPAKEHLPWAEKTRCVPPKYGQLCTTYNLSYMPNCNPTRLKPVRPENALKHLGTDGGDTNTIYKLSYIAMDGSNSRPQKVVPANAIEMPTGAMEKCTVHRLSYQPNTCVARAVPIRPKEAVVRSSGPLYNMTTQKHDFVPKAIIRRAPFRPVPMICRPTGGMEKCTINKLSYMPVNVCDHPRPKPIVPKQGVDRCKEPMEGCTTYKLSYLPNCMPRKEPLPWVKMASYVKPTAPMEKCTVQKLSYAPPGTFTRCGPCCPNTRNTTTYPKAGICN